MGTVDFDAAILWRISAFGREREGERDGFTRWIASDLSDLPFWIGIYRIYHFGLESDLPFEIV